MNQIHLGSRSRRELAPVSPALVPHLCQPKFPDTLMKSSELSSMRSQFCNSDLLPKYRSSVNFIISRLNDGYGEFGSAAGCYWATARDIGYWSNTGAWFHGVVSRKLTVVLFQPMPGLEEPDRNRLLPLRAPCGSPRTASLRR